MQSYSYKDIARMANVSIATVSHVINKSRFVSPELTARVLAVVEEINYKQNVIAGSLRNKRTRTIGLILPDSTNEVFAKVGLTVDKYCSQHGYSVIFCNSSYEVAIEKINIDLLRMKNVDGIIIIPASDSMESIEILQDLHIPFVVVNHCVEDDSIFQVFVENETAGYETAKYMMYKGRKNIIYLDRVKEIEYSKLRREGFVRACKEQSEGDMTYTIIPSTDYYFNGGYEIALRIMKQGLDFDAVVTYNDYQAIGLMKGLQEHGVRIPQDVLVFGFDNLEVSRYCTPSLSTMEYPIAKMGSRSAELLLRILNDEGDSRELERRHSVKAILIERESTTESLMK